MQITTTSIDDIQHVQLFGDVDGKTAAEVLDAVLPLIKPQGKLLLDLGGVAYMSSAGLRMLLSTFRQVGAQNAKLVLTGLADEIRDTMSITGFLHHFTICDTVEAAKAALA